MSTPLPDAGRNWVDARAPEGLKPWLKLGRFDRPIGIWLLLLPGWQGIALALAEYRRAPDLGDLWLFVGFGLGACLMRAAGCAFNDIVDRDIDARVARTAARPIPSGRISVRQAWGFLVGCSLVSLLILLTLNLTVVLLGVGSLALVAAYPFMKRITWWPQAWLGLTFNWGALMGFAAAAGILPFFAWAYARLMMATGQWPIYDTVPGVNGSLTAAAALLYLGGVFWTLGYDTIYALQDIEDDAMVGVKSTARRLGKDVRRGVAIFYGLAALCALAAGLAAGLGVAFFMVLVAYGAHFIWQVRTLKPDDGALALRLFKSNREAGLILLAAIALGGLTVSL
ncbi:4-hydroxybenzoate octaprenyltransferase [Brevundimonas sp. AJA228-03]|uniref:UbiA family prenyltransferase n=1 Tax=Brevundimonas sp. AJA228-03 TaxID=2752515 RepID=UPI001ADFB156|nr:UbiA family prenyltransferase [Brevundimonas sp. AJA228-03]QTN19401.1 4-hydroxybenzoate octaprenyltransferase [Brevundimonas sp. AJA228-03]